MVPAALAQDANLKAEAVEHVIPRGYCKACHKQYEPKVPDALPNATLGHRAVVFTAHHRPVPVPSRKYMPTATHGTLVMARSQPFIIPDATDVAEYVAANIEPAGGFVHFIEHVLVFGGHALGGFDQLRRPARGITVMAEYSVSKLCNVLFTQELARRFEELVRMAPEQWHVMQPNWPSDRGDPALATREPVAERLPTALPPLITVTVLALFWVLAMASVLLSAVPYTSFLYFCFFDSFCLC